MSWLDKKGTMESAKRYNEQHPSIKQAVAAQKEREGDVSIFSIEKRKGDDDDEIMHKSQSYSGLDVSGSGDEAEAQNGKEDIQRDNLRSPPKLHTEGATGEALEIPGNVPQRSVAAPVSASVKVGPQARVSTNRAKSYAELVAEDRMEQAQAVVRGPVKAAGSVASRVRVAHAWEVPGVGSYEEHKLREERTTTGSRVPQDNHNVEYEEKCEKEKIVLAVLDLLQGAARKAQTKQEVEAATRGHAIRIPSFRSGVSKRQAMAATGKMFMDMVPDYDPDFEAALQFMRSNDWTNFGDEEGEGVGETKESESDENPNPSSLYGGTAVFSATGTSAEGTETSRAPRPIGKTFPEPRVTTKAFIDDAVTGRRPGLATAPPRPQTQGRPTPINTKTFMTTATARTRSSPSSSGPPNFEADKDLRSVNASVENYATWLKPQYLKRGDVLRDVPQEEAATLTDTCERLYAHFLSDLIENCRKRADACKTTEEMAMLRVLAEQVTGRFAAGEPQEDLQCRMIQGALETQPWLKRNKTESEAIQEDDSIGIPSVSSTGLRLNRAQLGGYRNKK